MSDRWREPGSLAEEGERVQPEPLSPWVKRFHWARMIVAVLIITAPLWARHVD